MVPDRLIGPVRKLQRAVEHLGDLTASKRYFDTPHPYDVTIERDTDAKVIRHRFHARKTIPPEWSLIVGDLLHNLRSCLDLVAWQLVEVNGSNRADQNTKFPIAESVGAWETGGSGLAVLKRKGHAIHQDAVTVLRELKPYKGGNGALYALHRLNIADKHHLLIPTYSSRTSTVLVFKRGGMVSLKDPGSPTPLEEGAVLATMPLEDEPDMEPQFLIEIALGEAPVAGQEMLTMLDSLSREVDRVLKAFAPFLAPQ